MQLPLLVGADLPQQGKARGNPCLQLFGPGPEGKRCKGCAHLFLKAGDYVGRYYKCDLRVITGGPATDHRVNWPACGRYEHKEESK